MARKKISNELWKALQPLLPVVEPSTKGGRPRVDDRAALNGILFVLHTGIPWDSTMPSRDFAAVHLKTDWEKNLGASWEAVMRALGYPEAKVHRGPIGGELLGQLFARVKLPAAG